MQTYKAAPDIDVYTEVATVPGFGNLAINALEQMLAGAIGATEGTGAA
jgi:hypothetical protein